MSLFLGVSVPHALAAPETWLLLHGIWPGSGWDWQKTAYWLKQAEPESPILTPTLHGRTGLFKWADHLTHYIASNEALSPLDIRINIIAHSFSSAATLFLMRTAYELDRGDLNLLTQKLDCSGYWGNTLFVCKEMLNGWKRLLADPAERLRWIAAAQKIQTITLYHPSLQGGCGACVDVLGLAGRTSGALCLLERIALWLWGPIERLTWDGEKRILNLFGGMSWSISLCGLTLNDVALSIPQQKLQKDGSVSCTASYQEIDAGSASHISFIHRWNVAKDLVARVHHWRSESATAQPSCLP